MRSHAALDEVRAKETIVKLVIRRNQADVKGLFGGHKGVSFSLFGKCAVSDPERALIDKYKVGDYILASYTVNAR